MAAAMAARLLLAFLVLGVGAGTCLAQNLAGTQQTAGYRYGIGRISWTFPQEMAANFAVPHWTAGPRVQCGGRDFRCEVQVSPRDISIPDEDRRRQMEESVRAVLPPMTKQALVIRTHGSVAYVTLEDARPGESYRYLTVGYAHKGPALLKFELRSNDPASAGPVLALVDGARPVDALEMWALRLGDYRAVCEERFPAYKAANDSAFAASPFAAVDLVQLFVKSEPGATDDAARARLADVRKGFAKEFDRDEPERKRSFCEGFPRWVAEAATGL